MKKFLLLPVVLLAASCTTTAPDKPNPIQEIGCTLGKTIGLGLSGAVAEKLDCKNVQAINDDIFRALQRVRICSSEPIVGLKSVGSSICSTVALSLFNGLTAETFAKWQCSGGEGKEQLLAKVGELCNKL